MESAEITSTNNRACLEGQSLLIFCRSGQSQWLRINIPSYTGPGDYPIGTESSGTGNNAVFMLNGQSMAPAFTSTEDGGVVTITSFNTDAGLNGSFDLHLTRPGQTLELSNGSFNGVRSRCFTNDTLLTYRVDPLFGTSGPVVARDQMTSSFFVGRTDSVVWWTARDYVNVSNPSEQVNTFYMQVRRNMEAGTYSDLDPTTGSFVSYEHSGGTSYAIAHDDNEILIDEHDKGMRRIRGSYLVHLSGGQVASGEFDIIY